MILSEERHLLQYARAPDPIKPKSGQESKLE